MTGDDDGPTAQTKSLIGVVIAISGNILISLALNIQKKAHNKIAGTAHIVSRSDGTFESIAGALPGQREPGTSPVQLRSPIGTPGAAGQSTSLPHQPSAQGYHSRDSSAASSPAVPHLKSELNALVSPPTFRRHAYSPVPVNETSPLHRQPTYENDSQSSHYLESLTWWSGMALMLIGMFFAMHIMLGD